MVTASEMTEHKTRGIMTSPPLTIMAMISDMATARLLSCFEFRFPGMRYSIDWPVVEPPPPNQQNRPSEYAENRCCSAGGCFLCRTAQFPIFGFFYPSPPEKEPDTPPCFDGISGSGRLNLWPIMIRNQAV